MPSAPSAAPVRLICLPYAGGTQYAFQALRPHLHPALPLTAIDYPGHGMRMRESLLKDSESLTRDLLSKVLPFTGQPYALFGHSLGALMAFKLVHHLHTQGLPLPQHVFVSGRGGPNWFSPDREEWHRLPDASFIEKIRALGGTPDEVLDNPELMALMLPIIRADFALAASHHPGPFPPLDIPFTVLTGADDRECTEAGLRLWQEASSFPVPVNVFPGGHFFIFQHWKEIAALFLQRLFPHETP